MKDIIGVGNTCVDFLVRLAHLPRAVDENVRQLERSFQCGGRVATALVAAAELGGKASFVGMAGNDAYGDFIHDDLVRYGVDVSHLDRGGKSGFSLILSDDATGGRNICSDPYDGEPFEPARLLPAFVAEHKILHLERLYPISHAAAAMMREAGGLVSFDGDTYEPAIVDFLPKVDVFIGSAFFYESLFGKSENYEENFARIRAMGPRIVCFTFGAHGSRVLWDGGYHEMAGFQVSVRDTVGAGDVYHGAFLYALCLDMAPPEAARFANAAAAIKCSVIGGRAGIPNRATLDRFLTDGVLIPDHMEAKRRFYGSLAVASAATASGKGGMFDAS